MRLGWGRVPVRSGLGDVNGEGEEFERRDFIGVKKVHKQVYSGNKFYWVCGGDGERYGNRTQ